MSDSLVMGSEAVWTIYHNPRCSKSRQTLRLLQQHGIRPHVVEYVKTGLSVEELRELLDKLDKRASELLRRKERLCQQLGLDMEDEEAVFAALVEHPVLMERPVVVCGQKAVIGRPPENVRTLF